MNRAYSHSSDVSLICRMTKYIAIDCEMVGTGTSGDASVLARYAASYPIKDSRNK